MFVVFPLRKNRMIVLLVTFICKNLIISTFALVTVKDVRVIGSDLVGRKRKDLAL